MVWSSLGRGVLATLCAGLLLGFVADYLTLPVAYAICIGIFVWASRASARHVQSSGAGILFGLLTVAPTCVAAVVLGVLLTLAIPTFTLFTNMVVASLLTAPFVAICAITGLRVGLANQKRVAPSDAA